MNREELQQKIDAFIGMNSTIGESTFGDATLEYRSPTGITLLHVHIHQEKDSPDEWWPGAFGQPIPEIDDGLRKITQAARAVPRNGDYSDPAWKAWEMVERHVTRSGRAAFRSVVLSQGACYLMQFDVPQYVWRSWPPDSLTQRPFVLNKYLFVQHEVARLGTKYIHFQSEKCYGMPWGVFLKKCFPTLESAREAAHRQIDALILQAKADSDRTTIAELRGWKRRIDDPAYVKECSPRQEGVAEMLLEGGQ